MWQYYFTLKVSFLINCFDVIVLQLEVTAYYSKCVINGLELINYLEYSLIKILLNIILDHRSE